MSNETKVTYLPVSAIKVDPACQARAELNTETVNEYAEVMKERRDDTFPAIIVFHDGTDYWLSDGFHRYEAAKKAGLDSLKSKVRQGLGERRSSILSAQIPIMVYAELTPTSGVRSPSCLKTRNGAPGAIVKLLAAAAWMSGWCESYGRSKHPFLHLRVNRSQLARCSAMARPSR